jgi:2-dehydro-3-deoxygalactonokinase
VCPPATWVRNALTGHGECQSFNCDAGLAPTCRGNNPPEIGAIPARRFCSAGPAITFATLVPCADSDPGRAGDYHVAGVDADAAANDRDVERQLRFAAGEHGGRAMIAIDWGTTHLRAYRLDDAGAIVSRRSQPKGIMAISGGDFAAALDEITRDWHDAADREVVMSGMIGNRQGWVEVPYVSCPAALRDLADAVRAAPTDGARDVLICPGLVSRDADGVPDVMRGEEVQIFGALSISTTTTATVLLPGTHSKHAAVTNGSITGFVTHMTGEVFALLSDHSILGRLMAPRRVDLGSFDAGLDRARHRNGLLHHIFGVRTRMLMNELDAASLPDYLSGILIGHEIASAAISPPAIVVGEPDLGALYRRALDHIGIGAELIESDAATTRGLHAVAELRRKTRP